MSCSLGTGVGCRVKFLLQSKIFQFLSSISEGRCYCIACTNLYGFLERDFFGRCVYSSFKGVSY